MAVCVPEQGYFDYQDIPCDSPERACAAMAQFASTKLGVTLTCDAAWLLP